MIPATAPTEPHDGFWLPREVRESVLVSAEWRTIRLRRGAVVDMTGDVADDSVTVRWPQFSPADWQNLLLRLQRARRIPAAEAAARWRNALSAAAADLGESMQTDLPLLARATGYSQEMLITALAGGDLIDPASLEAALDYLPEWSVANHWETMPGSGGRVRFYPDRGTDRVRAPLRPRTQLTEPAPPVDLALGYAAGNVPGTALVMALLSALANHRSPSGTPVPAVLVRNSRHEPLFTPWVLSAVESHDPELLAATAVMIWDYDDPTLQTLLLTSAGLMLAAADDGTIATLDSMRARFAPSLRFHRHGHKVSFAELSSLWRKDPAAPQLAALDSSIWDQNGCVSARVHFVEGDAPEYARLLAGEMRSLAVSIPRGITPRRFTHRAFDTYAALTAGGRLRLLSTYDDDFAVVLDDRKWDNDTLRRTVNACVGRVVVVRPVGDLAEVPGLLDHIPPANLQSMSLLVEPERMEDLAARLGASGVTAVRPLGKGAFPNLASSWDGLLPLDLCSLRPPGHFTTIEPEPGSKRTTL
jgi:hypothetical protein